VDGLIACCLARVGTEPELRYLANGTPLLTFSAAVQDRRAKDGETQWVKVALFGEKAEALAPQLAKGSECYVEGRAKASAWLGRDDAPRASLELTAWRVDPIGAIGRRRPRPAPAQERAAQRWGAPPAVDGA
jgi:single stranded DNA-binding protein